MVPEIGVLLILHIHIHLPPLAEVCHHVFIIIARTITAESLDTRIIECGTYRHLRSDIQAPGEVEEVLVNVAIGQNSLIAGPRVTNFEGSLVRSTLNKNAGIV